jgi:hypothetical protein
MNRLTLKALLLSVITEMKFGSPIARNAKVAKSQFKELVGLPKNASNKKVLHALDDVYCNNKLEHEFYGTIKRLDAEHLLED